jgi:streptomycin 3"-adenylyltransferase
VTDQIERLLALMRDVLGADDLLAAYLHGSAVLGGLKPASDIDVLALSARPLEQDERRRLFEGLMQITKTPRNVELAVLVHGDVKPWRYPPRRDFQYGDWLRQQYEAGDATILDARVDPDLTVLLEIVLRNGRARTGPPAAERLDPIPPADLARAMTDELERLFADFDRDTRNILLTLARIWTTLATGEIRSKDEAAMWVLERAPSEDLARARELYLAGEVGDWNDLPRARAFAERMAAEIRTLA